MTDAKFEDGAEQPLRLMAADVDDLKIVSALTQDAVFPGNEMSFQKSERRFALLLNRFRWEDKTAAERRGRDFERVQAVLFIDDVVNVQTQGVTRDADTVYSLMAMEFEAGEDGTGCLNLTLSGDGAIALNVEALNVSLKDVTRPYVAPSKSAPDHAD
ncbi:DUF2948 family protein [Halocynthiibacter namhaensis]|uniref:DUF2948 family protein n=1 Tax=Halocynthiibacter namhaensis TaxID=1290553 RepID=UPI000578F5C8|nr:DUF2948 family protein [Halocynthiibacter namhaensis]